MGGRIKTVEALKPPESDLDDDTGESLTELSHIDRPSTVSCEEADTVPEASDGKEKSQGVVCPEVLQDARPKKKRRRS